MVRGSPRYLTGKAETVRPFAAAAFSNNCFPLPAANIVDFTTFIHNPNMCAKSLKTARVPVRELEDPSVKTTISSAKLKCVRLTAVTWDGSQ